MACSVLAFHGQVVAQSISSVAIDFQILTEVRPVAHQPGTLLYESDPFSLQNKYNTVTIHGLGLDLPENTSEVTWSVEFLNLGVGRAGLLLYDPPTLGDSHDDFWEKINGKWELKSTEAKLGSIRLSLVGMGWTEAELSRGWPEAELKLT